jgi:uncharacterized LabA/DUF88 family protein
MKVHHDAEFAQPEILPSYFEKVAIFIDLGNLYFAARKLNIRIDYRRLLGILTGRRRLLRAFAYAGVDPLNPESQGYLTWMKRNGYRVVTKQLRRYPDGTTKANLDVELAIDMLTIAPYVDTVVLVSGDGDFVRLVEAVQFKGVRVEVVGLAEMTATGLIDAADKFTELSELVPQIQMEFHYDGPRRSEQTAHHPPAISPTQLTEAQDGEVAAGQEVAEPRPHPNATPHATGPGEV